jgi:23S rRNA (uracil1939-C5)-methyltransferase
VGERLDIAVDHISLRGEGVARAGDLELRVVGLFDGERAEVEIVHRSKQSAHALADLRMLTSPHPARRAAPCPRHESSRGRCSGCPLMELGEGAQRSAKTRMLSALGLEVAEIVHVGPELGYRYSCKRVAAGERGRLALGSWARASHEFADMSACLVDHPKIAAAADELAREASALGIEAYDEKRGEGDLRYVWLKTNGSQVLLTLVTAHEASRAAELLPDRLKLPSSIAWSVQSARSNVIRGSAPRILRGEGEIEIEIAGERRRIGPLGFLQPNPALIERAYLDLVGGDGGALAWDLYAGAGITTALLRRAYARVVPCESYPESARELGVEPEEVASFLAARKSERPDRIVANPPRKGFGEPVSALLAEIGAPRLSIMSCGPESRARPNHRNQTSR